MNCTIWPVVLWLALAEIGQGQQAGSGLLNAETASEIRAYTVQGTTADRERLLRSQITAMQPAVLPSRVIFVPHWQYIYATKMYHLNVPPGMGSKMFTHLPSRSVYVDADRYGGDDWLGYWMAHELGHLERNNADENQAERSAALYRTRLNHKY